MSTGRVALLEAGSAVPSGVREGLAGIGPVETVDTAPACRSLLADRGIALVAAAPDAPALTEMGGLAGLLEAGPGKAILVLGAREALDVPRARLAEPRLAWASHPGDPECVALAASRALAGRALRAENDRLQETLALVESCGRMIRCLDAGTVYAVALDLLLSGTGAARGFAQFHQPSLPTANGLLFRGFSRDESRRLRQILAASAPDELKALQRGAIGEHRAAVSALRGIGIETPEEGLAVPLVGEHSESGVVYLFGAEEGFGDPALERARIIADQAQIALENAERYQGAKTRALIDDATGLHNMRYLLDAADHELERAARYGLQLSVLFVDIDRFKAVNDAHGHLVGTATLRHVATRLSACLRQIDTLARYGGDEFAILLTDTSPESAAIAAERIRETIAQSPYEDATTGLRIAVTVSIGIACYPSDSRGRDALVDLADKAMYRAKSLGRNRVADAGTLD